MSKTLSKKRLKTSKRATSKKSDNNKLICLLMVSVYKNISNIF